MLPVSCSYGVVKPLGVVNDVLEHIAITVATRAKIGDIVIFPCSKVVARLFFGMLCVCRLPPTSLSLGQYG